MAISFLKLENFRNLGFLEIAPLEKGLNIICGPNGGGKTSLLEAMYFLSMGRSFRTSSFAHLTHHGEEAFSIFSLLYNGKQQTPLGVHRHLSGQIARRIDERDATSLAEMTLRMPVKIIDAHAHQLFEGGPLFRRQYLDWGLFYFSPDFLVNWQCYERALKQRNTLLQKPPFNSTIHSTTHCDAELASWTSALIQYGDKLDALRRHYIHALSPFLLATAAQLLPEVALAIRYQPGWDDQQSYESALKAVFVREKQLKHTFLGPHRADLEIFINGQPAKQILSRGQQKLLFCAMIVAQGMLLSTLGERAEKLTMYPLIYLVDDLPAELDITSKQRLLELLLAQNNQVFITAVDAEQIIPTSCHIEPVKMFHVEHGKLIK